MDGIKEYYENFPEEYRITNSYMNYLIDKKKANICYLNNAIVIFSCHSGMNEDNDLQKKFEKNDKYIEDIYNKNLNSDKLTLVKYYDDITYYEKLYNVLNFNKFSKEKNIENLLIPKNNLLYDKRLINIINECKNKNKDGIALYIISIKLHDVKNDNIFEIDTSHNIILYYDFKCNSMILFNNDNIKVAENLEYFFKNDLKLDIINKKKEFNFICPLSKNPNYFSFQEYELMFKTDQNENGLCIVWQYFFLKKWIFRKNPHCDDDFEEFQKKILKIPDNFNLEKEIKKYRVERDYKVYSDAPKHYVERGLYAKILINDFLNGIMEYRNELRDKLKKELTEFKKRIEIESDLLSYLNKKEETYNEDKIYINQNKEKYNEIKIIEKKNLKEKDFKFKEKYIKKLNFIKEYEKKDKEFDINSKELGKLSKRLAIKRYF